MEGERGRESGDGGGETEDAGVDAAFDAKLHAGEVAFDGSDVALLRAIDDAGSLNAAATALGRSYSRAHKRLAALEDGFGPLVESRRGGAGGGGSALTGRARALLARFERLRAEFSGVAEGEETVLAGRVVDRAGELATVETDAGRLRALAPADATAVDVAIRADAVTLHDPDAAPPTAETSARNRFAGTVVEVDAGTAVVRVAADVGTDRPLAALVTARSSRLLDLRPGTEVVASFKTTATRAVPTE